jgi:dihydropteroate synthase
MTSPFPFAWGTRTFVMGIVNCTPDSFSGDGIADSESAIEQGIRFVDEGADILDVGGESTRPGAARIEASEEGRRVLPVIEGLAARLTIPISVDTYRASVARDAFTAGASIVNDVWALSRDPEMAPTVAESHSGIILMHNREAQAVMDSLGGHFEQVQYESEDILEAVGGALGRSVQIAEAAGIARESIIVDPGIGFGKSVDQNLELLRRLGGLKTRPELIGLPLLVGTSRKSVIGLTLNLPIGERLEGTLATLALAIAQGADIVRVHDVLAAVRCCRMSDAIVRGQTR